jgi:hypothetical protein
VIKDAIRIVTYRSPKRKIPLLPLSYRPVSKGQPIRRRKASAEDYAVMGAGLARSVEEAQLLLAKYGGDVAATLRQEKRRKRKPVNGWLRLWRRFKRWAV